MNDDQIYEIMAGDLWVSPSGSTIYWRKTMSLYDALEREHLLINGTRPGISTSFPDWALDRGVINPTPPDGVSIYRNGQKIR